jgi:NAD(P)H-hydrate epimerase
VRVAALGQRGTPDPLLRGWGVPTEAVPADDGALARLLASGSVLVDALLGTGFRGVPREDHARLIRAMNDAHRPLVSLDLPSGVDATTGAVPGEAVRAGLTVAFGYPKLGTLRLPGRERAGRIVAVEIGFPPPPPGWASARLITSEFARSARPRRPIDTHKKAEGRLLILAGSPGMAGAAVLAARGALRAGAGYVQVASAPENRGVLQSAVPEAIFVDTADLEALREAARDADAVVAGPGMGTGDAEAERLGDLLSLPLKGLVLDADALTLVGRGTFPGLGRAPRARRLLTPHPGEMSRLGASAEQVRDDPFGVARAGAARWDATVLLKGAPSLVADPVGGPVRVSSSGSSDLARAGMGDVLAGVAGAFLARGLDAANAAAVALHLTGRAAVATGRGETLVPSDVADALVVTLRDERAESSDLDLSFVTLDLDPAW